MMQARIRIRAWPAVATAGVVLAGGAGCDSVAVGDGSAFNLDKDTRPSEAIELPCDACGGDCILEELRYDARYHVSDAIDYREAPPAGGPHHPCWAAFGVHAEPVLDDRWVHNLEHGGVVALHGCGEDCPEEISALEEWSESVGAGTLTTPYDTMDWPFALVAWEYRLQATCIDTEAFTSFYNAYFDQAPESTLAGAPSGCM